MSESPPKLPWHPIPFSSTTCKVSLLQAGGLKIPYDITLLPGPNKSQTTESNTIRNTSGDNAAKTFSVPDFVFVVEHTRTKDAYLFDAAIRVDLENLPPYIIKNILPRFKCNPKSVASLLKVYGSPDQQPESIKAVMFSHMHYDHCGAGTQPDFPNAEVWIGPTMCTYARPGYPTEPCAPTLSAILPNDGSVKIVESFVPDQDLRDTGDKRAGKVQEGLLAGKYQAVDLRKRDWKGLGSFDRAYDVFGDGSAYLIDAPGHSAGHQMMLVRTTAEASTTGGAIDSGVSTFVLLAGDCFHHPEILQNPLRMARPPYFKESLHSDPEVALETIWRTRAFAEHEDIWVLTAHDFTVGESITGNNEEVEGLIEVNDWKEKGWKRPLKI